jgi:hypothetical protein
MWAELGIFDFESHQLDASKAASNEQSQSVPFKRLYRTRARSTVRTRTFFLKAPQETEQL